MSVVDLAGGLVNFVLGTFRCSSAWFDCGKRGRGLILIVAGHVVVIGVLIAAYVGYTAYAQKNQPGSISKKRN